MSRQEVTPVGTIEIKQNSCTNLVEQGTAGEGRLASMLHSASAPDLRGAERVLKWSGVVEAL